jgi:hypothetical protein
LICFVFQERVGVPMGTNCAPILIDLFFYSYEADFMLGFSRKAKRSLKLFRYSRAYHDLLGQWLLLTMTLLIQGFPLVNLKSSSFAITIMTWLTVTAYLCRKWRRICSVCRNHNPVLDSSIANRRVCSKSNTTSTTCGAGTELLIFQEQLSSPPFNFYLY